jgi:hypothetical protein
MFGHKNLIGIACLVLIQFVGCANKSSQKTSFDAKTEVDTGKSAIPCCYQSVLLDIKSNILKPIEPVQKNEFIGIRMNFLKERTEFIDKENNLIWLHSNIDSISDWDNLIDWGTLKKYGVIANDTPFLILSAQILDATGLSVNFTKWLIVNCRTGDFSIKQSLSDNPDFFYISSERQLTFYLFDYSREFLEKRNYNDVSLNIESYKVIESELIGEKQLGVKCICR